MTHPPPPASPSAALQEGEDIHRPPVAPHARRARLGSPLFSRKSPPNAGGNLTGSASATTSPGMNAARKGLTTTMTHSTIKRRSDSYLYSPRTHGSESDTHFSPKKKMTTDASGFYSDDTSSLGSFGGGGESPHSDKPTSSGVSVGPFLTGPLAKDYIDVRSPRRNAQDDTNFDGHGLLFPVIPAFVPPPIGYDASPDQDTYSESKQNAHQFETISESSTSAVEHGQLNTSVTSQEQYDQGMHTSDEYAESARQYYMNRSRTSSIRSVSSSRAGDMYNDGQYFGDQQHGDAQATAYVPQPTEGYDHGYHQLQTQTNGYDQQSNQALAHTNGHDSGYNQAQPPMNGYDEEYDLAQTPSNEYEQRYSGGRPPLGPPSYAEIVARSSNTPIPRSHFSEHQNHLQAFDMFSESIIESMSKVLAKTKRGRTHGEIQLTVVLQKIQTHLKILRRATASIRDDYDKTSTQLQQSLEEKRILEMTNQQLHRIVEQFDQERHYFQQHVLQFQETQAALLRESMEHQAKRLIESKDAAEELSNRISNDISELKSHVNSQPSERNESEQTHQPSHANIAPPVPIQNQGVPVPERQPEKSRTGIVLLMVLLWACTLIGTYFSTKYITLGEMKQSAAQDQSATLLASDLDLIVDRITENLKAADTSFSTVNEDSSGFHPSDSISLETVEKVLESMKNDITTQDIHTETPVEVNVDVFANSDIVDENESASVPLEEESITLDHDDAVTDQLSTDFEMDAVDGHEDRPVESEFSEVTFDEVVSPHDQDEITADTTKDDSDAHDVVNPEANAYDPIVTEDTTKIYDDVVEQTDVNVDGENLLDDDAAAHDVIDQTHTFGTIVDDAPELDDDEQMHDSDKQSIIPTLNIENEENQEDNAELVDPIEEIKVPVNNVDHEVESEYNVEMSNHAKQPDAHENNADDTQKKTIVEMNVDVGLNNFPFDDIEVVTSAALPQEGNDYVESNVHSFSTSVAEDDEQEHLADNGDKTTEKDDHIAADLPTDVDINEETSVDVSDHSSEPAIKENTASYEGISAEIADDVNTLSSPPHENTVDNTDSSIAEANFESENDNNDGGITVLSGLARALHSVSQLSVAILGGETDIPSALEVHEDDMENNTGSELSHNEELDIPTEIISEPLDNEEEDIYPETLSQSLLTVVDGEVSESVYGDEENTQSETESESLHNEDEASQSQHDREEDQNDVGSESLFNKVEDVQDEVNDDTSHNDEGEPSGSLHDREQNQNDEVDAAPFTDVVDSSGEVINEIPHNDEDTVQIEVLSGLIDDEQDITQKEVASEPNDKENEVQSEVYETQPDELESESEKISGSQNDEYVNVQSEIFSGLSHDVDGDLNNHSLFEPLHDELHTDGTDFEDVTSITNDEIATTSDSIEEVDAKERLEDKEANLSDILVNSSTDSSSSDGGDQIESKSGFDNIGNDAAPSDFEREGETSQQELLTDQSGVIIGELDDDPEVPGAQLGTTDTIDVTEHIPVESIDSNHLDSISVQPENNDIEQVDEGAIEVTDLPSADQSDELNVGRELVDVEDPIADALNPVEQISDDEDTGNTFVEFETKAEVGAAPSEEVAEEPNAQSLHIVDDSVDSENHSLETQSTSNSASDTKDEGIESITQSEVVDPVASEMTSSDIAVDLTKDSSLLESDEADDRQEKQNSEDGDHAEVQDTRGGDYEELNSPDDVTDVLPDEDGKNEL